MYIHIFSCSHSSLSQLLMASERPYVYNKPVQWAPITDTHKSREAGTKSPQPDKPTHIAHCCRSLKSLLLLCQRLRLVVRKYLKMELVFMYWLNNESSCHTDWLLTADCWLNDWLTTGYGQQNTKVTLVSSRFYVRAGVSLWLGVNEKLITLSQTTATTRKKKIHNCNWTAAAATATGKNATAIKVIANLINLLDDGRHSHSLSQSLS